MEAIAVAEKLLDFRIDSKEEAKRNKDGGEKIHKRFKRKLKGHPKGGGKRDYKTSKTGDAPKEKKPVMCYICVKDQFVRNCPLSS